MWWWFHYLERLSNIIIWQQSLSKVQLCIKVLMRSQESPVWSQASITVRQNEDGRSFSHVIGEVEVDGDSRMTPLPWSQCWQKSPAQTAEVSNTRPVSGAEIWYHTMARHRGVCWAARIQYFIGAFWTFLLELPYRDPIALIWWERRLVGVQSAFSRQCELSKINTIYIHTIGT